MDRINLVQRYVGAENIQPSLDKLGGVGWEKKKAKAREAIEEMAEELLKIYAARQVHDGFAFSPPDELCREFEAAFAFEETPDQLSAIEDVLSDMQSSKPMDRLVCGDVGYGKTEVAMRGAFKAVMDSKQVVVLVPTTVLAPAAPGNLPQAIRSLSGDDRYAFTFPDSSRTKGYPGKIEEGGAGHHHRHPSSAAKGRDASRISG